MTKFVADPRECDKSNITLVGGKAASLGEIIKAGAPTAPFFALTSEAYKEFIKHNKLENNIRKLDGTREEEAVRLAAQLRALIEAGSYPVELEETMRQAFRRLAKSWGSLAVRSSATQEDARDASFAGQYDSFLGVRTEDEFFKFVRKTYASLYSDRAVVYRLKMDLPQDAVYMATIVQSLVKARSAGVMFTVDPLNGDPSTIVLESSWGLGESVVKGEVIPDTISINKASLEILVTKKSHNKPTMYQMLDDGSVVKVENSDRNSEISISQEEALLLAEYGVRLENYFGRPQDIEWSIDKRLSPPDNVFLVQSRPVTLATTVEKASWQSSLADPLDRIVSVLLGGVKTFSR